MSRNLQVTHLAQLPETVQECIGLTYSAVRWFCCSNGHFVAGFYRAMLCRVRHCYAIVVCPSVHLLRWGTWTCTCTCRYCVTLKIIACAICLQSSLFWEAYDWQNCSSNKYASIDGGVDLIMMSYFQDSGHDVRPPLAAAYVKLIY